MFLAQNFINFLAKDFLIVMDLTHEIYFSFGKVSKNQDFKNEITLYCLLLGSSCSSTKGTQNLTLWQSYSIIYFLSVITCRRK